MEISMQNGRLPILHIIQIAVEATMSDFIPVFHPRRQKRQFACMLEGIKVCRLSLNFKGFS